MSLLQFIPTRLAVLVLALVSSDAHAAEPAEANALTAPASTDAATAPAVHRRGAWFVATSANFQVCSLESAAVARSTASACEQLRTDVAARCALQPAAWNPRCQIVLHASSASYESTVGAVGRATLASALVKRTRGQIALRQIDVRSDVKNFLTAALPHELCHVLLADRLPEPPLWCDEGLALQFDSLEKQRLHDRDLRGSLASGQALPLETLLTIRQYPAAEDWPAFYGQSASVVRCLFQLGDARQLIEFAELQATRNVHAALREVYGLHGCDQLDQLWRAFHDTELAVPHALATHGLAPPYSTPANELGAGRAVTNRPAVRQSLQPTWTTKPLTHLAEHAGNWPKK